MALQNLVSVDNRPLTVRLGERFGLDPQKLLTGLKATAFRKAGEISNEQLMALLVVSDQYGLNPFTREIYAFPDRDGAIIPIVSVDGWLRIINSHPQFDGVEFAEAPEQEELDGKMVPRWIECTIYRKDRSHPTVVREYTTEVYQPPRTRRLDDGSIKTYPGPWQTHTMRMMRHKVLIQGARVAFGFAGIFDEDEGQRIRDGQAIREVEVLDRAKPLVAMPRAKSEAVQLQPLPNDREPEIVAPHTESSVDEAVDGAEVSDGD